MLTTGVEEYSKNALVVTLVGKLTHKTAMMLRSKHGVQIDQARNIIFDLSELDEIDASGLGSIVTMFRFASSKNGSVVAVGTHGQPKQVFEHFGLHKLIKTYSDRDTAASNLKNRLGLDGWYVRATKRVMDIWIALTVLLITLPVTIVIAILIKLTSPGPIFYKQTRLGGHWNKDVSSNGGYKNIAIYKFRSMFQDAEKSGVMYPGRGNTVGRVTKIGKFLRSTRLDELPNFLNVLKGEMSVVGPRPERLEIIQEIESEVPHVGDRMRLVKPGVTGSAVLGLMSDGSLWDGDHELKQFVPVEDHDNTEVSALYRNKLYYDFSYQAKLENFWTFILSDLSIMIRTPITMFIKRKVVE